MKGCLTIILLACIIEIVHSQDNKPVSLKLGINTDYSYSGSTNTILLGPALFKIKEIDRESGTWHNLMIQGGLCWGKHNKTAPVTSIGYTYGYIPGLIFGVSTQQYHNIYDMNNTLGTDVRLSGEIVIALFGFIGYRYQHPINNRHQMQGLTRHAFFFRVPLPLKHIK